MLTLPKVGCPPHRGSSETSGPMFSSPFATELEFRGAKPIQIDGDFVGGGPARITAVADFAQLIT